MASNRTMDMALGKLGKKSKPAPMDDDEDAAEAPEVEGEEPDEEDRDEGKAAFIDMCKAIKAGRYEEAFKLWGDCKEMG